MGILFPFYYHLTGNNGAASPFVRLDGNRQGRLEERDKERSKSGKQYLEFGKEKKENERNGVEILDNEIC